MIKKVTLAKNFIFLKIFLEREVFKGLIFEWVKKDLGKMIKSAIKKSLNHQKVELDLCK